MTTTKTSPRGPGVKGPKRGISRHLEGWQPGLLAIFIALVAAALFIPRSVPPRDLPEPVIEHAALLRVMKEDARLAASAEQQALDRDVRSLGVAVRGFGLVDGTKDQSALSRARAQVTHASFLASKQGDAGLLALRAYQTRELIRELRRWETTGVETDALRELGGTIVETFETYGWVEVRGAQRRIIMRDVDVATLLKKRWNQVAAIKSPSFEVTRLEELSLLRFFIRHPILPPATVRADPTGAKAFRLRYVLKKLEAIERIDPTYPVHYARGIVNYQLGYYPQAVGLFRQHLDARPDGPFTLRAQNFLRASLGHSSDEL